MIVYKKKHHARYVCQSVLYNGESRNSNYDDLLWVHGPRFGNWSWQTARGGGTSSKNRLESPLIYIYVYIYISRLMSDSKMWRCPRKYNKQTIISLKEDVIARLECEQIYNDIAVHRVSKSTTETPAILPFYSRLITIIRKGVLNLSSKRIIASVKKQNLELHRCLLWLFTKLHLVVALGPVK